MTRLTLLDDLACSADTFWALYLSDEFSAALYRALHFPRWEVLERSETAERIDRRVAGTPAMNAPAFVNKLFGGGPSYDERGTFDKRTRRYSFTMTSSALVAVAKVEGLVRCEVTNGNASRRVVELSIDVPIVGLGGAVEKVFESNLRSNWNDSVPFLNEWSRNLATHAPAPAS